MFRVPLLFLILLLSGMAAALQPVDDFEVGEFLEMATSEQVYLDVPIPNHELHAITSQRRVWLTPGPSGDVVSAWSTDFGEVAVSLPTDGDCMIIWEWGFPGDLTMGGTLDRLELHASHAIAGTKIRAGIGDDVTNVTLPLIASGGPEVFTWALEDFAFGGLDPSEATYMFLSFVSEDHPAYYIVDDLRLRSDGSQPLDILAEIVDSQVPPIPSPPLLFDVFDLFGQPLYTTEILVSDLVSDGDPSFEIHWSTWSELGGDAGAASFYWDGEFGFTSAEFAMLLRYTGADPLEPLAFPPDPIDTPKAFLAEYPLHLSYGGELIGISTIRLQFEIPEAQGVEFENVQVVGSEREGYPAIKPSFQLVKTDSFNSELPMFVMTVLADWNENTATALPEIETVAGDGLRLSAQPSVTREGTLLQASRPFAGNASVTIYNVTGRSLGTLPAPAGAESLRWDGKDDEGRSTPAGIYFLRLNDHKGSATARVLRLR